MGYFSRIDAELRELATVSSEEFYGNDFFELREDHLDQPEMVAIDDLLWGKAEYDLRSKEYYIEEDDIPF